MDRLAAGIWRWSARHPEWHPGKWGAEVGSYAIGVGDRLLLVDPQLPEDDGAVLEQLDSLVDGPVSVLTTMPYHVRSSERLAERYGARIHGHPNAAARLSDRARFVSVQPGDDLPGGVVPYAIGKPRRHEMPLYVRHHRALVFGDTVVGTDKRLRLWDSQGIDAKRTAWYRDRFVPTMLPLLDLELDHVLPTHGEPVLDSGHAALRAALSLPPWG